MPRHRSGSWSSSCSRPNWPKPRLRRPVSVFVQKRKRVYRLSTRNMVSRIAEMNADFTRERLEFHKQLIDAHAQRDSAHEQLYDLGETVKLYQEQYAELEKNMKQGGASKKEVRPGQWTSSL